MAERSDATAGAAGLKPGQRMLGIGLLVAALACFAALDACAKWLNPRIGPLETIWVRYVGATILVVLALRPWSDRDILLVRRPALQVLRSFLLLGSTAANFIALQYLQLSETVTIMFAAPLIVALLSGPILGEWVGWRRLSAIVVGFIGVVVAMAPWQGSIHWAMLLSLAGAICYAVFSIVTRLLASVERPQTTMIYSTAAGVLVTTPAMPAVWVTPDSALVFAIMILIGALGAIGHYMVILAHQRAPASVLAPFSYSQLIWMVLLGFIVFGDVPDRNTMAGALIVIVAGLYLLHRERLTLRAGSLIAEIPPTGGGAKALVVPPARKGSDGP